ncbi:substrate-binding domain-containing protein [Halorubellus sp. JP-L1]|uniref:substrate-binding domain-containing protein n=1 Tax=Halorubellus sp. JP-L1 TaxID=2715753 RepID=UPI001F047870|nr:substrate-binding domain-containing protein [Halorubellus sp. JP-L1]
MGGLRLRGSRTRRSRRGFLAATAGTLASTAVAGCIGGGREPVEVLAAGSLQAAVDDGLRDALDDPIALEARGSAAAARLVADGQRDPDVLALADPSLFDRLLDSPWDATFATNALCVATADTPGGRAVSNAADREDADWYDPVLDGTAALGRTDPDLDPLGYRTLFALELAADADDHPGLSEGVLSPDQLYPETALLSQFETGALDAAVVYESMAADRGYEFVDLPPAVDLSDPDRADAYATATYRLPDGVVVAGDVVEYAAALRSPDDAAAERVFDALVDSATLSAHGFAVPESYPRYRSSASNVDSNGPSAVPGLAER